MSRWGTDHDPVGFWTILFAVAGGVLLADLVKVLLAAILAGAALSAFTNSVQKQTGTTPGHLPARPYLIESQEPLPPPIELLGPSRAMRDAVSRACVGGRAFQRSGAGWAQEQPDVPCIATTE